MAALLRCILACTLIACALGHAVMKSPSPLNTNPTTANPCGVSSYPTNPAAAATWLPGQTVTIIWELIATDGGVSVTGDIKTNGLVNPTSGSDFPTQLMTGAMNNGLNTYTYTFTVPTDLSCDGICLFRVATNTGWNSCTYVNITCAGCPAPPPPQPRCENPENQVTFCDGYLDGTNVLVPYDSSVASLDANAQAAYNSYINNTNVFTAGLNVTCQTFFHEFICKQTLVPCPGANEKISTLANCDETCRTLNTVCATNPKHSKLYNCTDQTQFPLCYGEGAAGMVSVSLVMLVAAAFMALF